MSEKGCADVKIFGSPNDLNEKGFTLLEILVAVTIFSLGMLAVATMQTTAMRGNTLSRNMTEAIIQYNQNKLEQLLDSDYNHADLNPGNHGPETDGAYATSWNVVTNSPYDGAKTVTVTTTWRDRSGAHTVSASVIKDSSLN